MQPSIKKAALSICLGAIGLLLMSSCHSGWGTRTIRVRSGDLSLEIIYSGRVSFTEDSSAIANISNHGFVKFERNGERLKAEKRGGKIVYSINGEDEKSTLDENEKRFVSDAVKEMMLRERNN